MNAIKPPKCCHPDCLNCPYNDCLWDGMDLSDYQDDSIDDILFPTSEKEQKEQVRKKSWRERNLERARENSRRYYWEHREQSLARSKRWSERNKDRVAAAKRARYWKDPELAREKQREYRRQHKIEPPHVAEKKDVVGDKIVTYIIGYIQVHGYSPKIQEIQQAVGYKSRDGIAKRIEKLYAVGRLETDTEKGEPRAIRVPGYRFVKEGNMMDTEYTVEKVMRAMGYLIVENEKAMAEQSGEDSKKLLIETEILKRAKAIMGKRYGCEVD